MAEKKAKAPAAKGAAKAKAKPRAKKAAPSDGTSPAKAAKPAVIDLSKAEVVNAENKKVREVPLSPEVFGGKVNTHLLYEAVKQYRAGGRPELADKEAAEIEVLRGYLPQGASEAEVAAAVDQAVAETGAKSIKDMGAAMKVALAALAATGKTVDGKQVSDAVRKRLQG